MLLEVANLNKRFGGLAALSNIHLDVAPGEVRGIIGPNGSGKSTLFNVISGVYKPEPGARVMFDGEDITGWEAHAIARRGVARTFQLLRIFSGMSVLENVMLAEVYRKDAPAGRRERALAALEMAATAACGELCSTPSITAACLRSPTYSFTSPL